MITASKHYFLSVRRDDKRGSEPIEITKAEAERVVSYDDALRFLQARRISISSVRAVSLVTTTTEVCPLA